MEKFREHLKEYRKSLGMTAQEFADKLGLPYERYVNYEFRKKSHRITFDLCKRLVNVFNVNITEWFKEELREEIDLEQKVKELQKHIIEFINELAWEDVKYDAMQSTMGEFAGSPSAVPRYAKKYFDLWKEMFGEELKDE